MGDSSRPTVKILFLAASQFHVEADYPVLVTSTHNRKIAVDIVLGLNNLLRALRYVGAVGQREVVGELLLNRDLRTAGRGVGLRRQTLRINLNPADSKQFLQAIADSGIKRLVDDEVRRLIIEQRLTGLLLQLFGLFTGSSQSPQRDDVRFRERRLRPVIDVKPVRRSSNRQIEIVIANVRRGLQVDLRLDRNRICKRDVAPLQTELNSVERRVPFQNVGAPQYAWACHRSTQTQIGITRQPRNGGLHLKFWSGSDRNIELDVVQRRVGRGDRSGLPASLKVRSEIETGSYGQLVDQHIAGHRRRGLTPNPVQLRICSRTHSRRIAQPHFLPYRRKIKIQLLLVVARIAFELENSATGFSDQLIDVNSIFRKCQLSVRLTQTARKARVVCPSILD